MITAAGAGASFCTVTPARLRPKTPKSPRGTPTQTRHQAPEPTPSPFLHNLLIHRTNSAPTLANSVIIDPSLSDYADDWDRVTSDDLSDDLSDDDSLFRESNSPTSAEFIESPSPKSFYSVATSSSGSTARGVQPPNFDEPSLFPMDQFTSSPQQSQLLQMMWTSNTTDSLPFSTSPEAGGFLSGDGDQSPPRGSRKKSNTREGNVRVRRGATIVLDTKGLENTNSV